LSPKAIDTAPIVLCMLSPETIKALDDALGAVIEEAGDDPQYADLVDALTAAQHAATAAGDGGGGGGEHAAPPAAEPDGDEGSPDFDPHSFDHAEKAMTKRRKDAKGKPEGDA
jgi:hypothetical protein